MTMTLDEFIESGCTSEQINKTSQTNSHFLPESFKKLHEEDCCIAEHLGIDPYYVLGALYQNTTQQKTTPKQFSNTPVPNTSEVSHIHDNEASFERIMNSVLFRKMLYEAANKQHLQNYAKEQSVTNSTEDTIQFRWLFVLFAVILFFFFLPDLFDLLPKTEPISAKEPVPTHINFNNNNEHKQDEWWGHMDDENDKWLLEKCRSIAKELKVNPNIITEAYYSSKFSEDCLGMTHCEDGKNLIRIRYNLANNNGFLGERAVIVHEVCHAISYKQGFTGHTPLWAGYMRQYAKLHPELATALEHDVRRYEAGFLGGIE